MNEEIQKVGLEAFNELAESHEAHVRQVAKLEKELKQYNKFVTVGLVFGVGLALALNSWLLGIMFGILFYVALKEKEKRKDK